VTCRHSVSLGAYLLGALDPAERSEFEEHLDTCDNCKAELLRLAPLPGLLQRLTPEEYATIEAGEPADLLIIPDIADIGDFPDELMLPPEAVLGSAKGPRAETPKVAEVPPLPPEAVVVGAAPEPPAPSWLRRNRGALVAAAAVVLLALGGPVVIQQPSAPSTSQAAPITWTAVNETTGVKAEVQLTVRGWGTAVALSMDNVPPGPKLCHIVVYGKDGSKEAGGWWTAGTYRSLHSLPASTSIKVPDIDRIEVVAGGGVLVGLHSP
jgi:hypothetical protein